VLTVKQTMAIATRNSAPPWRVSDLKTVFVGSPVVQPPLSVGAVVNKLGARKTTFFVQVRDLGLALTLQDFPSNEQPAELASLWAKSVPSKSTLQALSNILSASGGSIVYVDKYWQTVGIAGSTDVLANVSSRSANNAYELINGVVDMGPGNSLSGPVGAIVAAAAPSAQSAHLVILLGKD
jgi:hypothetical protein